MNCILQVRLEYDKIPEQMVENYKKTVPVATDAMAYAFEIFLLLHSSSTLSSIIHNP